LERYSRDRNRLFCLVGRSERSCWAALWAENGAGCGSSAGAAERAFASGEGAGAGAAAAAGAATRAPSAGALAAAAACVATGPQDANIGRKAQIPPAAHPLQLFE